MVRCVSIYALLLYNNCNKEGHANGKADPILCIMTITHV